MPEASVELVLVSEWRIAFGVADYRWLQCSYFRAAHHQMVTATKAIELLLATPAYYLTPALPGFDDAGSHGPYRSSALDVSAFEEVSVTELAKRLRGFAAPRKEDGEHGARIAALVECHIAVLLCAPEAAWALRELDASARNEVHWIWREFQELIILDVETGYLAVVAMGVD
jgi:hypothetical protein